MRVWLLILLLAGCEKPSRRALALDLGRIPGEGQLRTDVIGDNIVETATFVLVEAENTSKNGA